MFTAKSKEEFMVKKICSIGIQQLSKLFCSSWLCTLKILYRPLATCNKDLFPLALIILLLNTFPIPTLIISWAHKKNLRGTWREELLWIEHWLELRKGICQHLHDNLHPTNTSNVFSTLTPKSHAIHPTNGQFHHMAKALSMQKYQTTPHFLMKNSSKTYKARSGHYCTNHEHLIQKCYLL